MLDIDEIFIMFDILMMQFRPVAPPQQPLQFNPATAQPFRPTVQGLSGPNVGISGQAQVSHFYSEVINFFDLG